MDQIRSLKDNAPARLNLLETVTEDPIWLSLSSQPQDVEIDKLRQAAYSSAVNFKLPDPATVLRRHDPAGSLCFVVGSKRQLFATMRIALAQDRLEAERLLEGKAAVPGNFFPGAVLSRGATHPIVRGNGLMGFLVSLGVAVAARSGLGSALAVQVDGTPHFAAMSAAGWQSKAIGAEDLALVSIERTLQLVYLSRDRYEASARQSRQAHDALYRLLNPEPVIREASDLLRGRLR